LLVALGSTRAPKVEALRRVLAAAAVHEPRLGAAELAARDVEHDTPAMPLSLHHLLEGSRRRAEGAVLALRAEGRAADLAVGMEGGLELREDEGARRAFLMSWAYVTDGRHGAFGCGGAIEVPAAVVGRVVDEGLELSAVIDALVAQDDTRSRQGAWGVLTRGLLDRTRSFEVALVNAMAPFYNQGIYA
jgi:non-canonical (house-cleaning) NTP pyrophosphatase